MAATAPVGPPPGRLDAIDLLRGAAMVLMALDHTRDFFSGFAGDPTDLDATTPGLFLTRWVTHACAPAFLLLAGASAYLAGARGRSRGELSRLLLTRGLWLVALELTVVRFGWYFDLTYEIVSAQVIWAIGWSMVALAALIALPRPAVLGIGVALIAAHPLLDDLGAARRFLPDAAWAVLHEPRGVPLGGGRRLVVLYPLIPWCGVLAAGYGGGPLLLDPIASRRRRRLYGVALALIAGFAALRWSNLCGDPAPWRTRPTAAGTLASFVNCEKYPPSPLFLLMTLGPVIGAIPLLERARGPWTRPLLTFGRVPLFFYVLHLYAIRGLRALAEIIPARLVAPAVGSEEIDGFGLPAVLAAWIVVVAALYPCCRRFADLKHRHRGATWTSYL